MSYALSSGVTGLQAHQQMLDVAGNNLANVNTTAFKASRIGFAELLSQTLAQASQPTDRVGGTNPQQMGSGVGVASITPNMTQGSIVNTGNPLDVAIEGAGLLRRQRRRPATVHARRRVRRRCRTATWSIPPRATGCNASA